MNLEEEAKEFIKEKSIKSKEDLKLIIKELRIVLDKLEKVL